MGVVNRAGARQWLAGQQGATDLGWSMLDAAAGAQSFRVECSLVRARRQASDPPHLEPHSVGPGWLPCHVSCTAAARAQQSAPRIHASCVKPRLATREHVFWPARGLRTLAQVPQEKVHLAMTPTPIHEWRVPGVPEGCQLFVKRDDLSGMQLSGNKVRPHCATTPVH